MDREKVIAATEKLLKQLELGDLHHYKETTQEQFIRIEKYFLEIEERLNKALEEIQSINFNIRGICSSINISKSTIYNNPNTLRLYIEKRINMIEAQNPFTNKKNEKAQEQLIELDEFLNKAIIDQIEFNNLKVQNENLNLEVKRISQKNKLLNLERVEHFKKINEMELELRKLRNKLGNVFPINLEDGKA
ncbi:hypothetical protein [Rossellomorea sp. LjRoot5]|uniref:hypothetical protein n=1 Tax=Rossellomorea sp. LjRoot5 TaxID=3342331 RepID=UPI003ED16EB7